MSFPNYVLDLKHESKKIILTIIEKRKQTTFSFI